MAQETLTRALRHICVLCLIASAAEAQTAVPGTAHEGAMRLLEPHFGGPGDATVEYFGQLLAHAIETSVPSAIPLDRNVAATGTRAVTMSVDYRRLSFRAFQGIDLDSGDMSSFSGGLSRTPITYVSATDVSADVTTVLASAALTPRFAVTLRLPVVRLHLSGTREAIEDRGTLSEAPVAPVVRVPASTFTGLGDATTALEWWFLERDRVRMAGLGGIRWPTGDRENLIGTGDVVPEAGVLLSVAAIQAVTVEWAVSFASGSKTELGEFTSPPFSGPVVTRAGALDTWVYGVTVALTRVPRLVVRGSLALQTLLGAIDYERGTVRSTSALQRQSRFIPKPMALTVGSAGVDILFNIGGAAFATAGVTAPLTGERGLQPGLTPWVGVQMRR